jgi:sugar/nucleoside kinase (ribokinase family)
MLIGPESPVAEARRIASGLLDAGELPTAEKLTSRGCRVAEVREAGGGSVANALCAAAAMGADAAFAAGVGDDEEGRRIIEDLAARGVDAGSMVVLPGARTRRTYVFTKAANAEPRLVIHNPPRSARTPRTMAPPDGEVLHVGHAAERQVRWAKDIVRAGGDVTVDVGPGWFRPRRYPVTSALLDLATVVMMKRAMARQLARRLGLQYDVPPEEMAVAVLGELDRAKLVVVTHGAQGAAAAWHGGHGMFRPEAVEAVDPTGAGDCLAGVLLAACTSGEHLDGPRLPDLMRRGVGLAAESVTHLSARGFSPTPGKAEEAAGRVAAEVHTS